MPAPQVLPMLWYSMLSSLVLFIVVAAAIGPVAASDPVGASARAALAVAAAAASLALRRRAGRSPVASIVCFALCEAIGALGLVAFLLSGSWPLFAGFAATAFVLLLIHAPRPLPAAGPR